MLAGAGVEEPTTAGSGKKAVGDMEAELARMKAERGGVLWIVVVGLWARWHPTAADGYGSSAWRPRLT